MHLHTKLFLPISFLPFLLHHEHQKPHRRPHVVDEVILTSLLTSCLLASVILCVRRGMCLSLISSSMFNIVEASFYDLQSLLRLIHLVRPWEWERCLERWLSCIRHRFWECFYSGLSPSFVFFLGVILTSANWTLCSPFLQGNWYVLAVLIFSCQFEPLCKHFHAFLPRCVKVKAQIESRQIT